jgi:DNA-binding transcriptional MerR regulator
VPVPTIKYYLREGLLPPGERSAPNQASYGEPHARRLRLIRAMIDVGGLPVATVREVLGAVDTSDMPIDRMLGEAHYALTDRGDKTRNDRVEAGEDPAEAAARRRLDRLIAERGWWVDPVAPAAAEVVTVLATLYRLGQDEFAELVDTYAAAADQVAADLDVVGNRAGREEMVESAVLGTVLGERLLAALRLLAHQHASGRRFPGARDGGLPPDGAASTSRRWPATGPTPCTACRSGP